MGIQSSAIEQTSITRRALDVVRAWVLPFSIWLFVLADGLVTRNSYEWAAPFRAVLLAALFLAGVAALFVYRRALDFGAALCVGVVCSMLVSQAYHQPQQPGLELWVIFGLAYFWQRTIGRDWSTDFRRAGLLLAGCAIWLWLAMRFNGLDRPPEGVWNQNVIAGVLAAFIPSSLEATGRFKRWVILTAMVAAIAATGSRGGLLAAMCAILFAEGGALIQRLPRRPAIIALSVIVTVALVVFFVVLKPVQSYERVLFWKSAGELLQTSPMFGIGPGPMTIIVPWHPDPFIQAHNTLINFMTMTGLSGAFLALVVALLVVRWRLLGWQTDTLLVLGILGLADDPFTWLPTILICALVLGGTHGEPVTT